MPMLDTLLTLAGFSSQCGVGAILVGESIVKQDDTEKAVKTLLGLN